MSTPLSVRLDSIEIANIHDTIEPGDRKPGTMVAVRPCDEELKGKTFLGMYLCAAPIGVAGEQVGNKIVLKMIDYTNPAIYIPELDRIVWGYGSWWGEITSEEQLHQITDADIANVWYVRALKELQKEPTPA